VIRLAESRTGSTSLNPLVDLSGEVVHDDLAGFNVEGCAPENERRIVFGMHGYAFR
jgi:hypothetical protein